MSDRPTIVLAHYDSEALSAYRSELEAEGFRVQATGSGPDVLKRIETQTPDAVVLDPLLPRMNGLSVLKSIKASDPSAGISVVMVLDEGDTYTENRALICGADAIVKRGSDGSLADGALAAKLRSLIGEQVLGSSPADTSEPGKIERLLETASQDLREENPVISHITDSLTGLYNAEYMNIKMAEEYKRTRRFGHPLTVVDLELSRADGEEQDTDSDWRHVLNEIAGLLLCESRDIDILGRSGGANFRMILPHTDLRGASQMVDRVLEDIARRQLTYGDSDEPIKASAGLAEYVGEGVDSSDELERRAREAVRQAWRTGGSCHVAWTPALG